MLNRDQAAEYIGVSVATLASWAHTGVHRDILPVARIGKRAFYRRADLDKWLESRFSVTAR
jgi:excisionase family DNA binding protein